MTCHRAVIKFYNDKLQKVEGYMGINNIKRISIELTSRTIYHASFLRNIQKSMQQLLWKEKMVNLLAIVNMLNDNGCIITSPLYISDKLKNYNFNFNGLRMQWTAQNALVIVISVAPNLDKIRMMARKANERYIDPMVIKYCENDATLTTSAVKAIKLTHAPDVVICSGPVTTIIMKNGAKYQVRKSKNDKNDYEKAFMMAWLYSLVGEKVTRKTLEKFEEELQKKPRKSVKKKKEGTK